MCFDDAEEFFEDDEFISNDPERELAIEEWEVQQSERQQTARTTETYMAALTLAEELTSEERCRLLADIGRINCRQQAVEVNILEKPERKKGVQERMPILLEEDIPF